MPGLGKQEGFIALGSNLGDRELYLAGAIRSLEEKGIRVLEQSPVYETKAVGYLDQPDFLNMVVRFESELPVQELLNKLLAIEAKHGRIRKTKWGPRTLDLDLLFYGKLILDDPKLTVPHPRIQERAFVLMPLQDLAPDLLHPLLGLTVKKMAEQVPGKEGVRRWEKPLESGFVPTEN